MADAFCVADHVFVADDTRVLFPLRARIKGDTKNVAVIQALFSVV